MIALGAVAPLVAQTVPGVSQITNLPTVNATYTIDLLTALNSGVTDSAAAPVASALVIDSTSGAVSQIGTATLDTANITLINNDVTNISAIADALNLAGAADATADVNFGVEQVVTAPDVATANLINNNSLNIVADAASDASTTATSTADVLGITQSATGSAIGSDAALSLVNNAAGVIAVSADALAIGDDSIADAFAVGAVQSSVGDTALSSLTNDGDFTVDATATADGVTSADASSGVIGIAQSAGGLDATVSLLNSETGVFGVTSNANATGDASLADAFAIGVQQSSGGDTALSSLTNDGDFTVDANATADGVTSADASSGVYGILQSAGGLDATVSLLNSDTGVFGVSSNAIATGDASIADAFAAGVQQSSGGDTALSSLTNDGDFTVDATATAAGVTSADASSEAAGSSQFASGPDATVSLVNNASGVFGVSADALATGDGSIANASALGAIQSSAGLSSFTNNGDFTVDAIANANGVANGAATAEATGLEVTGGPVDLAVINTETFDVTSNAAATGTVSNSADASATGMRFTASDNVLSGSVINDGLINVDATAVTGLVTSADAVGIEMVSDINNLTLTNTGTISATAITNGGLATATGLVVRNDGVVVLPPVLTDSFTLNNIGGSFIARQSVDGGLNFTRGTAIDTSDAPHPAMINLQGAGSIYGNVDISADDLITVSAGETRLDGIVNPLGELEGALTIANGGTLYLVDQPNANPSYDGAAGVNVDTFTVAPGGTLALQLATSPVPVTALLDYPTVVTNTANLAGTLLVRPTSVNGLYGNSYVYNDVIDANTRVGTFSNVVTNTGTPLLRANAIYDAENNVDLNLTRVAFGGVAGLTRNETAVGNGIEGTYNSGLTGPYGTLLGNLFTQNAANYPGALDQLSGAQYAGYVQGLRNYSMQTNTLVSDQIDCAISVRGMDQCRDPETRVRLWGLGGYNDVKVDTDINAPGYKSKNWFALLGVDYTTGNFTFGGFGGYRKTKMAFDRYNGRIKADGWQLGLLAAYDIGSAYLRGVGSYSDLGGHSRRDLSIGTTSGMISGKPDARLWSFYGEGGARIGLGGSWLTPFVGVDYTTVKLKSFTETGVPGANLAFRSQSDNQTALLAGVKWAANFGGLIPEAKVAYRHDFGSRVYGVDASFADAPVGTNFRVYSPETKRGSIVAGLSLAAAVSDQLTGRIGYQGRFNSDVKDHAFYGSLTLALGASAPAAPPPPPPAPPMSIAPPPPPPPAVVECQSGPYIVFFDFDRSDITPEAASILDNALVNYGNCGKATVVLAGHADKSGSNEYNQALSERRNSAVRGYMTSRGVPDGVIASQAFGETRPLVDTADGVKEPQNRRVEIQYGPGSGN